MSEEIQSLPYVEGANQLLRALYEKSAKDATGYVSYDTLVKQGEVAAGFKWVRRFVDDMKEQSYIDANETIGRAENVGMRILPSGQTHVEGELAANPAWGSKPIQVARSAGGGFGRGTFGSGTFGGPSSVEESIEPPVDISVGPQPVAGTAFSVSDSTHGHEVSSPAFTGSGQVADPSAWTGIQSRNQRLAIVRSLFPLAQDAIEQMIQDLSRPGANGGPLLDETKDAIEHLRNLHTALGEFLSAVDGGSFDDELGEGLAAETVRYAKRALESVRSDPMRYSFALLIYTVLSAFGLPGPGGLVAGAALGIEKPKRP